jgi:hypothetical protein
MVIPRTQGNTIDDYIVSFLKNVQDILEKLRRVIKESVPTTKRRLTMGCRHLDLMVTWCISRHLRIILGFFQPHQQVLSLKKSYLRSNRQRDLFNF